jgi:sulfate adenylyltransferase subunit 2
MKSYQLSHLDTLESEAIYIFREAASQLENCILLFSGGKYSIVLANLAKKAFWPAKVPFSILHVDTGHNFEETIKFRDEFAKEHGFNLANQKCSRCYRRWKMHRCTIKKQTTISCANGCN